MGDEVAIALTSDLSFDQPGELVFRYHSGMASIEWTESIELAPESSFIWANALPADVLEHLASTEHDAWLRATLHIGPGLKLGPPAIQLTGNVEEPQLIEIEDQMVLASEATVVQNVEGPIPFLTAGGTDDQ